MTWPVQSGNIVKLLGRMLGPRVGMLVVVEGPEKPLRLFVSIILREAIMISISQSWKRSTTSAQVSWKRFSFSNLLKTVDLISTNWLDMRRVRRALE